MTDYSETTILLFMKLRKFSQNLSAVDFSKFSTFSKIASCYEVPILCDVIILDEIIFFPKSGV